MTTEIELKQCQLCSENIPDMEISTTLGDCTGNHVYTICEQCNDKDLKCPVCSINPPDPPKKPSTPEEVPEESKSTQNTQNIQKPQKPQKPKILCPICGLREQEYTICPSECNTQDHFQELCDVCAIEISKCSVCISLGITTKTLNYKVIALLWDTALVWHPKLNYWEKSTMADGFSDIPDDFIFPEMGCCVGLCDFMHEAVLTGGCEVDQVGKANNSSVYLDFLPNDTFYCELGPKMESCRFLHSSVNIYENGKNMVFVIGGIDSTTSQRTLSSVEILILSENKFIEGPTLMNPRSHASCVQMGSKIYIIGGFSGDKNIFMVDKEIEVLDTSNLGTTGWTGVKVNSRPNGYSPMAGCSAMNIGENIYILGGSNGKRVSNTFTKFSLDMTEATALPCFHGARASFRAMPVENKVCIVFGLQSGYMCESYDFDKGEWENCGEFYSIMTDKEEEGEGDQYDPNTLEFNTTLLLTN